MTLCLLCNSPVKYIGDNVLKCTRCDSHQTRKNASAKIYDMIYSLKNEGMYAGYFTMAVEILDYADPMEYLSHKNLDYSIINDYVRKCGRKMDILDVGCGYGYLSYALSRDGHNVAGEDISRQSIDFARKIYGLNFSTGRITGKYDLIILSEVIEHLPDPGEMLRSCIQRLKKGGKILVTTCNKDYYPANHKWNTDPAPIHMFWPTRKGLMALGENNGLSVKILKIKNNDTLQNHFIEYLLSRVERQRKLQLKNSVHARSVVVSLISLLRKPMNLFYRMDYPTIGVLYEK